VRKTFDSHKYEIKNGRLKLTDNFATLYLENSTSQLDFFAVLAA